MSLIHDGDDVIDGRGSFEGGIFGDDGDHGTDNEPGQSVRNHCDGAKLEVRLTLNLGLRFGQVKSIGDMCNE